MANGQILHHSLQRRQMAKKLLNKLTDDQIQTKVNFIKNYMDSFNTADGSIVDPNSNVDGKNIGILESELYKFETIQINRAMVEAKLIEMFGSEYAHQYEQDIKNHLIYIHDETSLRPYCASINMFPYLFEGTKPLGGTSTAPTNLQSFCGSFVNLVYQVASGFAGAIATVEFLMYFDHFARKSYGDNYLETNAKEVAQELQGVVYAINQPASARGNQSVFWNISVFDKFYFESVFGEFTFPDGDKANYTSIAKLQDFFMNWFREEREKELLTYPVLTSAVLVDKETGKPKDDDFAHMLAKHMSKGLSFFVYQSESADSLASCCRLRNELADNTFSYTLGAGGVSTGSVQVITINMNRFIQRHHKGVYAFPDLIKRVQKYLMAHRAVIEDYLKAGLLPAYSAGFISLDKQFCTIGINGMLEGMEYLRVDPVKDPDLYIKTVSGFLNQIYTLNKEAYKDYKVRFNTEFVPAENLGVKNAQWDKADGIKTNRDCYNSYFYPVENTDMTILDRLKLHGKDMVKYLDGGSACHLNIAQLLTEEQAYKLLCLAGEYGCNYWTFNCLVTICDNCGYINVNTEDHCTKCGETEKIDYGTRVIGYLRRVSNYSEGRRKEHATRNYMKK